ncbi:hypothetical protein HY989_00890 [Candidatus Micrarchaeota archaeon]|nr:hypothetical protein [Candidatus Micrarchaeota archaeon]
MGLGAAKRRTIIGRTIGKIAPSSYLEHHNNILKAEKNIVKLLKGNSSVLSKDHNDLSETELRRVNRVSTAILQNAKNARKWTKTGGLIRTGFITTGIALPAILGMYFGYLKIMSAHFMSAGGPPNAELIRLEHEQIAREYAPRVIKSLPLLANSLLFIRSGGKYKRLPERLQKLATSSERLKLIRSTAEKLEKSAENRRKIIIEQKQDRIRERN